MDDEQKKTALKAGGGALGAVFLGVVLHPLVIPALAVGGAYAAIKTKKGPKVDQYNGPNT